MLTGAGITGWGAWDGILDFELVLLAFLVSKIGGCGGWVLVSGLISEGSVAGTSGDRGPLAR